MEEGIANYFILEHNETLYWSGRNDSGNDDKKHLNSPNETPELDLSWVLSVVCLVPEGFFWGGVIWNNLHRLSGISASLVLSIWGAREGLSISVPLPSLILYAVVCVIIKGAESTGKQEPSEQRFSEGLKKLPESFQIFT